MVRDEIRRRWLTNAHAAGVPLTSDDVERIEERGMVARVEAFEAAYARLDAAETVPDHLHTLTASEDRHA